MDELPPVDDDLTQLSGPAPGARVWVGGHNRNARRFVQRLLANVERPASGPVDLAVLTPDSVDEGIYFSTKLRPRLVAQGQLWIVVQRGRNAGSAVAREELETWVEPVTRNGFTHEGCRRMAQGLVVLRFRKTG